MTISQLIVILFFLSIGFVSSDSSNECKTVTPCTCSRSDGYGLDLSKVNKGNAFLFTDDNSNTWQYSLCQTSFCGGSGNSVICKTNYNFNAGDLNTAKFITTGSDVSVQYTAKSNSPCTSTISLVCDQNTDGTMVFNKEDPQYTIYFTIRSKFLCLSPLPDSKPGISVGDVLLIIFFVGLFLYFVIGMLFQKFYRHVETGLDLIPNRGFWVALPFLFVDGVKFTMYKTVWRNKAEQPYNPI